MTPPRHHELEEARRRLDEAGGAIDEIRRLTGAGPPVVPAISASDAVKREALEAAREALRRTAGELEAARARGAELLEEVRRLREELAARPTGRDLDEARAAGESAAAKRAAELSQQVSGLKERLALLSAERVRLETLRRKAETSGSDSEAARRAMEETLRRDLAAAHAALDRAAAESGTREAKAVTEIEALHKRLDQALNRLHREDAARKQASAEQASFKGDFEAAEAVIASLRKELSEQRALSLSREREYEVIARGREREIEERSRAREGELAQNVQALERRLNEALNPPIPPAVPEGEGETVEAVDVAYPSIEYALEPGWTRLLRLVKPPLQAAYGHLRRLSAGPLSAGQRAILRLTGSSLSQAADSLATIELALADTPATSETASVLPVVEAALAAWEGVFRRRGIALARELARIAPDAPHDAEQLRLAMHHVLRNAVEALARGSTVRVQLRKSAANAAELEIRDDGPGYPPAWLERQFEPFVAPRPGHAGLGLAAVRRALRRWGGDASASAGAEGRGACLTLTFAAAPARPAAKP